MEVKILEDQNQIDEFIKAQRIKSGSFLQSYEWGEFQKHYGYKIWRLGIFDQAELKAVALVIKYPLPLGKSYFYCPKGPILEGRESRVEGRVEMFNLLFGKLKEISKNEKVIFIKFEPPVSKKEFEELKENLALKEAKAVQPQNNWLLDLDGTEEGILARMKQKTRYNIRLAQKKGVKIKVSDDSKQIDRLFALAQETAERNDIKTHPKSYYLKMIEMLARQKMAKLYQAEYNQKILAVNLMLSFGDTATYLHGGSSNEYRNVMAPYLLHWQAILDAKKEGKKYYDFGGVAPENESNHKWAGISRFKRSFGGFQVNSPGALDMVIKPFWYKLYQIGRRFKK